MWASKWYQRQLGRRFSEWRFQESVSPQSRFFRTKGRRLWSQLRRCVRAEGQRATPTKRFARTWIPSTWTFSETKTFQLFRTLDQIFRKSSVSENFEILRRRQIQPLRLILQELLLLGRVVKFYHRTLRLWRVSPVGDVTVLDLALFIPRIQP